MPVIFLNDKKCILFLVGYYPCDFISVKIPDIPAMGFGWMYPYNSMLQLLFDDFTLSLVETGIYSQLDQRYESSNSNCEKDNFTQVDFNFVTIMFNLLALGIIISIILLLFEHLVPMSKRIKAKFSQCTGY